MLGELFVVHLQQRDQYLIAFPCTPLSQNQLHLHVASPKSSLPHQNSPQLCRRQIVHRIQRTHHNCNIARFFGPSSRLGVPQTTGERNNHGQDISFAFHAATFQNANESWVPSRLTAATPRRMSCPYSIFRAENSFKS